MSVEREQPKNGGDWLGNARVYERGRLACLKCAEEAERQGQTDEAVFWRGQAAADERNRDRAQRRAERATTNPSPAPRRRYYRAT